MPTENKLHCLWLQNYHATVPLYHYVLYAYIHSHQSIILNQSIGHGRPQTPWQQASWLMCEILAAALREIAQVISILQDLQMDASIGGESISRLMETGIQTSLVVFFFYQEQSAPLKLKMLGAQAVNLVAEIDLQSKYQHFLFLAFHLQWQSWDSLSVKNKQNRKQTLQTYWYCSTCAVSNFMGQNLPMGSR